MKEMANASRALLEAMGFTGLLALTYTPTRANTVLWIGPPLPGPLDGLYWPPPISRTQPDATPAIQEAFFVDPEAVKTEYAEEDQPDPLIMLKEETERILPEMVVPVGRGSLRGHWARHSRGRASRPYAVCLPVCAGRPRCKTSPEPEEKMEEVAILLEIPPACDVKKMAANVLQDNNEPVVIYEGGPTPRPARPDAAANRNRSHSNGTIQQPLAGPSRSGKSPAGPFSPATQQQAKRPCWGERPPSSVLLRDNNCQVMKQAHIVM